MSSTIGLLSAGQQQTYFFSCLSESLATKIQRKLAPFHGEDIYIYRSKGDLTSLMNILEDYFATTYPIHVRRADLAKLRKSSWMRNSEFVDLYIQKCNEAQVLGRSAENTDCGNCIELHMLNAFNWAALLDN